MRHVLLVTYFFPPLGGGGVPRPLKLAKYLPEFGWAPHVLTVRDGFWNAMDETPLAELGPEVRIHRTRMVMPGRFVKRALGRGNAPQAPGTRGEGSVGLAERAKRVFRTIAYVPDEFIGWFPFALREGTRIVAREGIEAVISTSPPHTAHLVGRAIARRTGLPWIADFRDGWTQNPGFRHRSGIRGRIERWLERSVVRSATRIVTVSDPIRSDFLFHHPDIDPQRIRVILNGFDPMDFQADGVRTAFAPAPGPLRVVYTGGFLDQRSPRFFFEALAKCEAAGAPAIEAVFAGTESAVVRAEAQRAAVSSKVEIMGYLPVRECCALQRRADLLIVLLNDGPGTAGSVTGKIFQYLAAGRPVLAMVPEGAAADIVRKTRAGFVVASTDVEGACRVLLTMARDKAAGKIRTGADPAAIAPYTRRAGTEKFAAILEEVAHG